MPRLAPSAPDAQPDDIPANDDAFSAPEPTGEVSDAYPENGLTDGEVTERVADGRVNRRPGVQGMRTSRIVLTNVLSPVNGIMLALFVLIDLGILEGRPLRRGGRDQHGGGHHPGTAGPA